MDIRCDEYNGVCVVAVRGDLSGDAVVETRRVVDESLTCGDAPGFVFDFEGCEFMDSAGLELMCRVRRRCDQAGKRMTLARVGASCAKILEITRLAGRFDCHADLDRALRAAR